MKPKLLAVFSILFVVILALSYSAFRGKSQSNDIYSQLQNLPNFDRKSVEGHYFVLHFWAKWCAPCVDEIPHVVSFAQKAESQLGGLKVLAVSLDESLEAAKSILPNQGSGLPSNFLLLLDTQHAVAEGLGSYQYPESYLYDPTGKVVEKWVGAQKWDDQSFIESLKQKLLPKP